MGRGAATWDEVFGSVEGLGSLPEALIPLRRLGVQGCWVSDVGLSRGELRAWDGWGFWRVCEVS